MSENINNEKRRKSINHNAKPLGSIRKSSNKKIEKSTTEEPKFQIEETMKTSNIPLKDLSTFDPSTDFITLIQNLKQIITNKDYDWTYHLAVINYLRRLLKFEKDVFDQIMYGLKIYPKLIDLINSIRSVLAKNTLLLINEIFNEYIPEYDEKKVKNPVINFIKIITPVLIMKANCNQSFIKTEATQCLESLVKNMKYGDTLISLIQAMTSKKNQDIDLAYNLCLKLINNFSKEYLIEFPGFNDLIKSIMGIYDLKKDIYVKKIVNILKKIIEKISENEFNIKLEKCPKKEKEIIKKALNLKNNKKRDNSVSSSGFHNFIKESKEKMKIGALNKKTSTSIDFFTRKNRESSNKKNG